MSDEPNASFSELLRSPIPENRRSTRREPGDGPPGSRAATAWVVVAGMVVGVVAVTLGYLIAGPSATIDDAGASSTTTVGTVAEASPFPEGYVPVTDLVAIHPEAVTTTDEGLLVGFSTAVRRGFDPDLSTPFQGGDFSVELADGTTYPADRIAFDSRAPGSFSVAFALPEGTTAPPQRVRLSSLWSRRTESAFGTPLDLPSIPFTLPEPLEIAFEDGSRIRITRLVLDASGGSGTWEVPPGDGEVSRVYVGVTGETSDGTVAAWFTGSPGFFFPGGDVVTSSRAASGSFDLTTADGATGDPGSVVQATIDIEVDFVGAVPAGVTIDLSGVPATGF